MRRRPSRRLRGLVAALLIVAGAAAVAAVIVHALGEQSPFMSVCGERFCIRGETFTPNGATVYASTPNSGIRDPAAAVAIARDLRLNALRVVNFFDPHRADPRTTPFSDTTWRRVDRLIAAAGAAHLRVVLDLADYRNTLLAHCVNPYTYDWTRFLTFVAHRTNAVTHVAYIDDPTIILVSFAGEPLPPGTHGCVGYTSEQLTGFYRGVAATWRSLDPNHLVTAGGLGYLNFDSHIDWRSIVGDPDISACAFKTYGRMAAWVRVGATYCNWTLHKPWFDDEWGFVQALGDSARASAFRVQLANDAAANCAGDFFWNAGFELAPTSYDVGPQTPDTADVVRQAAHELDPSTAWRAVTRESF